MWRYSRFLVCVFAAIIFGYSMIRNIEMFKKLLFTKVIVKQDRRDDRKIKKRGDSPVYDFSVTIVFLFV